MTSPRDSQRSRLYKAEGALKSVSKRLDSMDELTAFVERVRNRATLRRWYPCLAREVYVGDGRMRRRAGGDARGIYMPRWSRTEHIVLHELAHTIIIRTYGWDRYAAHGPEFCRVYANLVGNVMGQEAWKTLRASFKKHRVRYASM